MKRVAVVIFAVITSLSAGASSAAENRCGWIENPTPRNLWLEDKDQVWTITSQGNDSEPDGIDRIPDFTAHDFIKTQGDYGIACACMTVETDGKETITKILAFKQLGLARCRNDKSLKQYD